MAITKKILTSLHGRAFGIAHDGKLVVDAGLGGRTVVTQDDEGAQILIQGAPATINASATMLAADLMKKIVTSTSAAAVVATVPTGTLLDAAAGLAIGEAFEWNLINTGPSSVTVTASTGHTLVGTMVVATVTSAAFSSRKTAANTFVTYRLS